MLSCLLKDISVPRKSSILLHLLLHGCIHFFRLAFISASNNYVLNSVHIMDFSLETRNHAENRENENLDLTRWIAVY